jgi:DHA1 family multidrug resistance protein-like MFS transporter
MDVPELSLTALAFLTGLSFAVVSPVLPLYVESFGVSYETLGLFFSAYSLTWSLLQLYTGYLSDRYGRRRLALIGLAVYSLSALGCAQARDFTQLFLFRIVQGVGLGLFGPALLGLVAGLRRQERAFALYRTAQAAGDVIGPVVGGYLGHIGLSVPFLLSAVAGGLAIAATCLIREETSGREPKEHTGFLTALRTALSRPGFLFLCGGAFLAEMGYVARGIVVPLAGQKAGLTTEQIGLAMSAYPLAFVLSQVPIGVLIERKRRKRVLAGCALAAALGFLSLFVATSAWGMALAMGVLGLTLGTIFVQSAAWIAKLAPPERKSLYLASFDALIDLSFPATPVLVGLLAGLGVHVPFLFCALLLLTSACVLSRVPEG